MRLQKLVSYSSYGRVWLGSLARRLWGELNAARIHHRDAENAELDQTRIRPRPDAFGQPALRRCNLSQLGCIFACRTAGLGLLTEPPAQLLEGPYFLASKRFRKLINYMPRSSFSEGRKVPKSLAFIALAGLLLIAAVAFVPNSSAGLPAVQRAGGSESKRSRPEFVPGEALVRFKSDRAFEGSRYMPVPSEGAPQRFG